MGSALLVSPRASVARDPRDAVLAGALAGALVTRLAGGSNWVAVACCNGKEDAGVSLMVTYMFVDSDLNSYIFVFDKFFENSTLFNKGRKSHIFLAGGFLLLE